MIKVEQIETITSVGVLEQQIEETTAARLAIGGGFVWDHTTQGHEYWERVVSDLKALEDQFKTRIDRLNGVFVDEDAMIAAGVFPKEAS